MAPARHLDETFAVDDQAAVDAIAHGEAERARFLSRFFPGMMRTRMKAMFKE